MKKTDDRWFAGYCMGNEGAGRRHMHYKLMVILIVAIVIFSSLLFFVRFLEDSINNDEWKGLTVYYTNEEGNRDYVYVSYIRAGDTIRIGDVMYEYRGGEGRDCMWPVLPKGSETVFHYRQADINEFMANVFILFPVCFVIAFVEVILNYRSFYRPAKSIYVMKRLRSGSELHRRCLTIPLLTVLATLAACVLLGLFFLLYYQGNTKPERLPDTISLNVWRTLIWWR
ncbi:MAG: hypothetical protein J6Y20_13225 [Lachnospiraceae bacterium]|nr:hypothetical protein [Lachnospiraceae bacterium]